MKIPFFLFPAMIGTIALGVSACSGPFGSAYSGPHACTLLTAPLAQSVIGKGAKQTQNMKPSDVVTQCQYRGSPGAVTVEAGNWGWLKPMSPGTPVPALGDEAYVTPFGLVVRKNDRAVRILIDSEFGMFSGASADKLQAHNLQLEKQLAPKLVAGL